LSSFRPRYDNGISARKAKECSLVFFAMLLLTRRARSVAASKLRQPLIGKSMILSFQ
jgi:hypothetical protein